MERTLAHLRQFGGLIGEHPELRPHVYQILKSWGY